MSFFVNLHFRQKELAPTFKEGEGVGQYLQVMRQSLFFLTNLGEAPVTEGRSLRDNDVTEVKGQRKEEEE